MAPPNQQPGVICPVTWIRCPHLARYEFDALSIFLHQKPFTLELLGFAREMSTKVLQLLLFTMNPMVAVVIYYNRPHEIFKVKSSTVKNGET